MFDGVAFATDPLRAVWSEEDGLFWRPLDAAGAAAGDTVRLGARCGGGLATTTSDGSTWLACARRPDDDKDVAGVLSIERRDGSGEVVQRTLVRPVGRDAAGVSMVASGGGVRVAWHDGVPGAWRVWWVQVDVDAEGPIDPVMVSAPRHAAGAPSLLAMEDDEVLVVWAETWLDAGFPHGRIQSWRGRSTAETIQEIDVQWPTPTLVRHDDETVMFFRDHRRPWRRTSVYAVRLDAHDRTHGEPVRVGRANTEHGPRPLECGDHLWVGSPRTWDTEVLVGINVLGDDLQKRVPEQQVYQWGAHFAVTDLNCSEGSVLSLVGERGESTRPEVALRVLKLHCD